MMLRFTNARPHVGTLFIIGLMAAILTGSMTARGAAAPACASGDVIHMMDPVVTVIEGPGDPMAEQERLEDLAYAYLEGPFSLTLGETQFNLEAVP